MKENYDFSQGKRGAVVPIPSSQVKITLPLDKDIIDWFQVRIHELGGGDYHELINQALRDYINHQPPIAVLKNTKK